MNTFNISGLSQRALAKSVLISPGAMALARMLDAPNYPKAFIKLNKFKFKFNDIKISNNKINAKVEIVKNEK